MSVCGKAVLANADFVAGKCMMSARVTKNEITPRVRQPRKYGAMERPQGEITAFTCMSTDTPENARKKEISGSESVGSRLSFATEEIPPVISRSACKNGVIEACGSSLVRTEKNITRVQTFKIEKTELSNTLPRVWAVCFVFGTEGGRRGGSQS